MYALSQDKVYTIQQKGMTIRAKILVHVAADTVVHVPSYIHVYVKKLLHIDLLVFFDYAHPLRILVALSHSLSLFPSLPLSLSLSLSLSPSLSPLPPLPPSAASLSEVWSCCVWYLLQSQVSSPIPVVQATESVYQLL